MLELARSLDGEQVQLIQVRLRIGVLVRRRCRLVAAFVSEFVWLISGVLQILACRTAIRFGGSRRT